MASSSSFGYRYSYDVFLSFRGKDTRYGFTGNLHKALCDKGIHAFIDDEDLQSGDEITPSLANAIQDSRIAIPVFSINYADSTFCLNELVNIMDCFKANGRLVLPVFYDVDPSDVRYQNGSYGEALAKLEERFKDDMIKVQKWRMSLRQASNLSGYHFKHGDGYEHKFIKKIVEAVSRKIKRVVLPLTDCPVGLEHKVSEVTLLMDVGSNDGVYMIGIHGIGGMGKTTLALAVYNLIADHFDASCFLENVRENSSKNGLVHLQNIIISELLGEKKIKITGVQQGISVIQRRLQQKKVLLVLDDVDKLEQLQAIVGQPDLFGLGSRVIITTRDKHLLACHGVERTYEVEGLDEERALELLSWKAFKTVNVNPSYKDVLNRAVTYAGGLPLALEVIGSNLFGKSVEDWESALDQYERIPNKEICKILKVSFDALEEEEQSVFLDIACCFKGYALENVESILHAHYGGCMKYQTGVLVEKSLLNIYWFGTVTLHDLIEDMGKDIVRQESSKEPGKRSRLWFHEDIVQVLEDNQGTAAVEILRLVFPLSEEEKEVEWDGKAFKMMTNLRTLIIKNGHFSKGPKHLPNSLRVLEWWEYPSPSLPYDFHPKKLSIFKLPNNFCLSLDLAFLSKKFMKLKVLNLDRTKYLTEIPDVSGLPNLEEFSFEYCENLTTIHNSVGFLDKLKILNAFYCCKLRNFPPMKLPSLEKLELSGCSSLEIFPEVLEKMENITHISLRETCIREFPFSFPNLTQLHGLYLQASAMGTYFMIPRSIVMMPELVSIIVFYLDVFLEPKDQDEDEETVSSMVSSNVKRLCLVSCNLSDDFFTMGLALFANVKELDLSYNNFTMIPASITECRFLRDLKVSECHHLQEIRGVPPNLKKFEARNCNSLTSSSMSMLLNQELHEAGSTSFILPVQRIPEWFEHRSMGSSISFWFRNKFPAIAFCLDFELVEKQPPLIFTFSLCPMVIINGNKHCSLSYDFYMQMDHMILFDMQKIKFESDLNEVLLENEWNHAEVSYKLSNDDSRTVEFAKECGIHVFKQKSIMEDIRFTDPKLDFGLSI